MAWPVQPHSHIPPSLLWRGRTDGPEDPWGTQSVSLVHTTSVIVAYSTVYRCKGSSPPRPPPCLGILKGWRGRGEGEGERGRHGCVLSSSRRVGALHVMERRKGGRGGGCFIVPGLSCVVFVMCRVVVVMHWWLDGPDFERVKREGRKGKGVGLLPRVVGTLGSDSKRGLFAHLINLLVVEVFFFI